ncbi:hypothetical protein SAMN02745146_0655 [Hymenobacter daecheongensis DSM 21074]|uniref:Outer membrane efflux protein n=1 Tax=Hymenobacter daecheongensis DSM 21074 TaxID=1121955 RepID=A0A1M6AIT8_9BACT|nr:hypothetical protein [Hymenobacter daecheongensis]SHI36394.1 hypothetical protein SAMN02745146_0655 [Hymenobacter daecheongensis DSM 21074]
MLRLLLFLLLALVTLPAQAQLTAAATADYLPWSATRRLTAADFRLALRANTNMRGSSAVFQFGMEGNAYDLLGKRGNAVVHNNMFRSASWLDTTEVSEVSRSLRYQQTLFDIQEIYARRLRQQGRANAWKIIMVGKPDLQELSAQLLKEDQQRQVKYTEETAYGTIEQAQEAWERQILKELQELQAFQLTD